jgi:serine acetyltransferase
VVLSDVAAGSLAVGVPARIISRSDLTHEVSACSMEYPRISKA